MRECDRQQNRERRDRLQREAERIVTVAHRLGGQATAVVRDDLPDIITGTVEGTCPGCFHDGVTGDDHA